MIKNTQFHVFEKEKKTGFPVFLMYTYLSSVENGSKAMIRDTLIARVNLR